MHHHLLGPLARSYRTSASALAVLWYLSIGPLLIALSVVLHLCFDHSWILAGVLGGALLSLVSVLFLAWSTSAHLDVHREGIVVGRRLLGGEPRAMWFTEIHPASIRVFSSIDSIRPLRGGQRMISPHWHISAGADLAVTFLGPDRRTIHSLGLRSPRPVQGIVIFGSRDAMEIAAALRSGLERGGCPPHLARWSEQFGVQEIRGTGLHAQDQIPGVWADWRP
ncbi:hypothetical protein [Brachybacterium sp.]|uniref:hypothetical protein n=1 Tax=Brachybacterium sp. TaxID=1891286 RepID=UPI002ED07A7B